MQQPRRIVRALQQNISKVIVGKEDIIRLALIAMLCGGHVLIEDVPGVGKTMLCSALAKSLACSFKRIQFTPDVTPSDVTGFSIVNFKTGELEFRPGAVMSQIVLADEINRTSPKTQSSLLEVMEEKQVTVDGVTYPMPQPFMVLATQNPVEFVGTYPLPEAQMDRFFMRISIGYPSIEDEMDILERYSNPVTPLSTLEPVCRAEDVLGLQEAVQQVYCSKEVRSYIANICAATRKHNALQLGASTRAAIALVRASQACALLDGRDFILPEDVQSMSGPVLAHRIMLSPESRMKGLTTARVLRAVLESVSVPVKLP
jgi:MoxR-like ATPase